MLSSDIMQFVPTLVVYALTVPPFYRLICRAGKSRWLLLVLIVPMLGIIIGVWILAFTRWPAIDRPNPVRDKP